MANRPLEWKDDTGLLLYVFPGSQSLGNWTQHSVPLDERGAPDSGLYDAVLDDSKGLTWYVFETTGQPASFSTAVGVVNLPDTSTQGTGANTVTFTVRDSATNALVQGALVTISVSGNVTAWGTTNSSGVVVFALNAGVNAYTVKASGYSTLSSSITVSANASVSASITQQTVTPSDPGQVTGYWTVYDNTGAIAPNAVVRLEVAEVPDGSTGIALDSTYRTATANGSGVAQFTGLFKGVSYKAYRQGSTKYFLVTVPSNAASPVALGSIIG